MLIPPINIYRWKGIIYSNEVSQISHIKKQCDERMTLEKVKGCYD